jgi:hypothetical protein
MALPFGYTLLPGPPTAPPPNGYNDAPGANGQWYRYPVAGQDNSALGGAVTGQESAAAAQENAFGLGNIFDTLAMGVPVIGPGLSAVGGATNAISGVYTAGKAAVGFLGFISDLPRLATTLIGVILIIAGIFALSRGPAVQVLGSLAKDALVA